MNNIFIGDIAMRNAEFNPEVPQAFGYTIQNQKELAMVITNASFLDLAQKKVGEQKKYPTIFALNRLARLEFALSLGGRLPTREEQKAFWSQLPGRSVLEKAANAGIPFVGYFSTENREFRSIGLWTYLVSDTESETGKFTGLNLSRSSQKEVEF